MYAPGTQFIDHEVARLAGSSPEEVDAIVAASDFEIDAINDDGPFFWHFSSFPKVLSEMMDPIRVVDPEDAIGERVLILLLAVAIFYAAIFLLLPFVVVRKQWAALPAKGVSAVYFAALGLGFMFFEITMIQRMTRLLGYPTYSLTVTLASILVTAGLGAMLSGRLAARSRSVMPILLGALAVLTLAYQTLLDPITDSLLSAPLGVRVVVTILLLAPLGLCLGMFMPFGLGAVAALVDPRLRIRRVGLGRQRVLLGHRLGADDDVGNDVRLQPRAVVRARDLRGRGIHLHPPVAAR